jgi:hypothetical protein
MEFILQVLFFKMQKVKNGVLNSEVGVFNSDFEIFHSDDGVPNSGDYLLSGRFIGFPVVTNSSALTRPVMPRCASFVGMTAA